MISAIGFRNISSTSNKYQATKKQNIQTGPTNNTTMPAVANNYFAKISFKGQDFIEKTLVPKVKKMIFSNDYQLQQAGITILKELPPVYAKEFFKSEDPEILEAAISAVAKSQDPKEIALLSQFTDEDIFPPQVTVNATVAMAKSYYDMTKNDLNLMIKNINGFTARSYLPRIQELANKQKCDDLKALLKSDNMSQRMAAAIIIGKVESEDINQLEELLDPNMQEEDVVLTAIKGVVLRGDKNNTLLIAPLLKEDDEKIAHAAAEAIGQLGNKKFLMSIIDNYPEKASIGLAAYLKYCTPHSCWD